MPAFSYRTIKELYGVFWTKAVALTQAVAADIQDNPETASEKNSAAIVEINHWSTKVTMDIIGLAVLGRDFNSLKNGDDPLVALYEEVLEPTPEKSLFFTLHLFGLESVIKMLPWKVNERLRYTTGELRRICRKLLDDKKEKVKTEGEQKDILSVMLATNTFGDDNLIDQLLTFLAAGSVSHVSYI